jgi:hypothetical protein
MKQLSALLFASVVATGCNVNTPTGKMAPQPTPPAPTDPSCSTITCDPNATCSTATVGVPACTCNAGFSGNGMSCTAIAEPQTCADILAANPSASDGDYTLYIAGAYAQPWPVYCADMNTVAPVEYLTLVDVLGDSNFGEYLAGGASPGTTVRTSYIRLRIDPKQLAVDIGDQRFTSSTGSLVHAEATPVSSMPFGVAMACGGGQGSANIDLSGTPFQVTSTFAGGGGANAASAVTQVDAEAQIWDVSGGGGCGWEGPTGAAFNPFNTNGGGFVLHLAYVQ